MSSGGWVSRDIVIITVKQLEEIKAQEYARGVERGRFEERCPPSPKHYRTGETA